MNSVRSDNDSASLDPVLTLAANGDRFVERDDNLDRVVGVRRDKALSPADQQETTVPQVPAGNAQPAVRRIVQVFVQGIPRLFTVADLFKNFSDAVQSSNRSSAILWGMPETIGN